MLKVKIYRQNVIAVAPFGVPNEVFVGDYFIQNFIANFQIKSSPSFSFEIDFGQFTNFPFIENTLYSFYLYRFDTLLYTGLIGTIDVNYVNRIVKFTCEDRTFYLSFFPAIPLVRWETRNVLAVIQYLFDNSQQTPFPWLKLSGTATVRDLDSPTRTILVDTTNDETLLAQINTILGSIPNAYLFSENYLGANDHIPSIPLESLGWAYRVRSYESTPIFNIDSENITSFTTSWEQQPSLGRVIVYGAEYDAAGTPAITSLADKTIADITGFPSNLGGSYVTNTASYFPALDTTQVRQALKIFDEIKPKTLSSPGANQRARASNALYRRAVRFLQEYVVDRRYNLSVNQDLTGVEIGNRVRINQNIVIPKMSQTTAQIDYVEAGNLNLSGDYFVESFRANYTENETRFDLVILDNDNFLTKDPEVVAYKSKKDQKLKTYNVEPTVKRHGFFDLTLGPGLAINCGGNGRSFTFTKAAGDFQDIVTVPAANAAADYYWYYVENLIGEDEPSVVITTSPTIVGATFTFCVSVNGTWTTSDSVRFKVLVAWT